MSTYLVEPKTIYTLDHRYVTVALVKTRLRGVRLQTEVGEYVINGRRFEKQNRTSVKENMVFFKDRKVEALDDDQKREILHLVGVMTLQFLSDPCGLKII